MDRGVWWTPSYQVAKNRTWLSDWVHIKSETKKESWKQQEKSDWSHAKWASIRLLVDFIAETLQSRKEWNNILKLLKEKEKKKNKLSTKKTVSGKTVLQNKEVKTFQDKQKLREFITTIDLFCKKYWRESFQWKRSCGRQQYRAVWKYTILS